VRPHPRTVTLAWTLACGSAKAIAAVMDGKPPDIDLRDFAFDRF